MQRIEWVHRRFEQWALWAHGTGGAYGAAAMFNVNRVDQTDDVRAGMRNTDPAFNAEALETDRAVAQLPDDLKRAVIGAYVWEGGMQVVAEKLKCTRATLHRRLCCADRRVIEWIDARRAREAELRKRGVFATYT
ncbi:hypothetical protein BAU07_18950 [Bordetella flabilis]|uniref:Uncharacterized protein n=2 Tax=Bordetella flabilis TaxID=463014 RepID=A0A193GI17_9BORD|nr:hypothetical protein BAU07_18950 [Bordetella flabilis]